MQQYPNNMFYYLVISFYFNVDHLLILTDDMKSLITCKIELSASKKPTTYLNNTLEPPPPKKRRQRKEKKERKEKAFLQL